MLTLTGQLTEYMDVTHDTGAENKARGIRRMNELERALCTREDFWWLEKTYTYVTVAGTQSYVFPIDYRKTKEVTVTNPAGSAFPVIEIVNQQEFDAINIRGTNVRGINPIYFHIEAGRMIFYPAPASSGLTVTVTYLKRPRDMKTEDYSTGTITATNATTTIVGAGTTWNASNKIRAGNFIFIDDLPYEVASVTDTAHLELSQPYQGTTASSLAYIIGDVSAIYEDFHDVLWKSAAKDYFSLGKENEGMYQVYRDQVNQMIIDLKSSTRGKSTSNVLKPRNRQQSWRLFQYPIPYP